VRQREETDAYECNSLVVEGVQCSKTRLQLLRGTVDAVADEDPDALEDVDVGSASGASSKASFSIASKTPALSINRSTLTKLAVLHQC
jgi:hypothetical protein